ncbi:probable serine/threonine-protein kinase dyrk1 [Drosophila navojoa]|uniref:probable serine/threonine-protein kinase dyrk1 n=1 Tax=Drosophila navojoa TaxID=7232 RepID=UPI0011BD5EB3|nr:probable serine/threonine-protein kinase dyrk1 [Drosophila navojoa]
MGDNRAVKQKTSSRKDDNVVAKVATYGHRNPIHIPPGFILKVPISLTCTECLREFQPKPLGALRLKEVEGQIEELSICQPCMTKNPFLFRYLVKYASRPRDKGKPLSRLQKTVKRLELMRLKLESSKSVYSETQAPDAKARTDRAIQLVTDLIMKFEDFQSEEEQQENEEELTQESEEELEREIQKREHEYQLEQQEKELEQLLWLKEQKDRLKKKWLKQQHIQQQQRDKQQESEKSHNKKAKHNWKTNSKKTNNKKTSNMKSNNKKTNNKNTNRKANKKNDENNEKSNVNKNENAIDKKTKKLKHNSRTKKKEY